MATSTPKGLVGALELITMAPDTSLRALGHVRSAQIQRLHSLTQHSNVVGVGISEKTSDHETTGELSVCFYVRKKKPPRLLRGDAMIPPLVLGSGSRAYLTDVKEIGACRLHAGGRELTSGVSVSHASDPAGTIGAIVRKAEQFFILSNSHVLAMSGKARLGDPVLSPGTTDGGSMPSDHVARLTQFVPFDRNGENAVDAAIAQILPNRLADIRLQIPHARVPIRTLAAQRGMQVAKFGKSTRDTTAHVIDVHFRLSLPYPRNVGLLRFVNQVLSTAFADSGDSGSLVTDVDTGRVVGLHFAGSDSVSICNPIGPVMEALGVSFTA
jgi:hypothetical protein